MNKHSRIRHLLVLGSATGLECRIWNVDACFYSFVKAIVIQMSTRAAIHLFVPWWCEIE